MSPTVAIAVLSIAVAGVGAQWLAWRLKLPAIVLLFATGLIVGPGLQILRPAVDLGPGLRPIIGLAVAIVVFEGGLALDFRELRAASEGVWRLTAVALPISFVLATLAAALAGGMDWRPAVLFGAITVVTGPTVILPLLRNVRLERRTASFLKWEAIVNDPIGALLAALVLALMLAGKNRPPLELAGEVALSLVAAIALGVGAAGLVRWLVTRDQVPETLKTPILLALAMGVYVVANLVMDEAGLAAATIFGIALANMHIPGVAELARFKESLVVLIVSALFVVLTASLERATFAQLDWHILLLTLAMVFLVRPAAIWLATARSDLTWQERALAGWIAPRGIVAAAVAGVASAKLGAAGVAGGNEVMPAVFALIAVTMVLHGFSLKPVARRLGLTLGDRPGLAILGATPWSIELGAVLAAGGTPVLMIDAYAGALDEALEQGLPVLRTQILSEHGEDELAGRRVDYFLAATTNDVYNSLVCAKLSPEIGRARVFQMAPGNDDLESWLELDREWRGQIIGAPPLDFKLARKRFRSGWRFELREHGPKEENSGALLAATECEGATAILAIRRNGDLSFTTTESPELTLEEGDRLLVLAEAGATTYAQPADAVAA